MVVNKLLSMSAGSWLFITFFLNTLLILVALGMLFVSSKAQLSAEVNSEVWSIKIDAGGQIPSELNRFSMLSSSGTRSCGTKTTELQAKSVLFKKTTEQALLFDFSVSNDGGFYVVVRDLTGTGLPYGFIDCNGTRSPLNGTLKLIAPKGRPVSVVTQGKVQLGAIPRSSQFGNSKLLLSGKIIASASTFPLRSGRVVQTRDLRMGDVVQFYEDNGQSKESVSSIVAKFWPQQNSFQIVSRTTAKTANVSQFGSNRNYPINSAPSLWARIEAQGEWTIFIGITALVLNIINAFRHYSTLRSIADITLES